MRPVLASEIRATVNKAFVTHDRRSWIVMLHFKIGKQKAVSIQAVLDSSYFGFLLVLIILHASVLF